MKKNRFVVMLALGALALGTAACSATPVPEEPVVNENANVPSDIAKSGVLRIATYAVYPPMTSKNEAGEFEGADIELVREIADRWGVEVKIDDIKFEGLLTGVQSDRYDLAIGDISATAERVEQVAFVEYAKAFSGILVLKGNPHGIFSLDDLCGHPVATKTASLQTSMLQDQSERCVAGGKAPITLSEFPDSAQLELELRGGRSVAQVRDFLLAQYRADHDESKQVEVVTKNGEPVQVGEEGPVGIAVTKENKELQTALRDEIQRLIDDGTYERILDDADASAAKIDKAAIYGE